MVVMVMETYISKVVVVVVMMMVEEATCKYREVKTRTV